MKAVADLWLHKWAVGGNLQHLLNDPDDNRDEIGSIPILEIIYSWSKIVRGNCRIIPDAWYCKIERKVEEKGKSTLITEKLAGPYKVIGELENGKLHARHYVFGAENKLVMGAIHRLDPLHLIRVSAVDLQGMCHPSMDALTDVKEVQSVWYPGDGVDFIDIHSPLFEKFDIMQVR